MLKDHLASQHLLMVTRSRIQQVITGRERVETEQYTFRHILKNVEQSRESSKMVLHCKRHGQSTLVARETGVCLRYRPPKKVEIRVVVRTIEQSASRSDWWSSASIGIPVSNALVTKREGGSQDFAYPGFAKAVIDTLLLQSKGLLKSTVIRCVSTTC